MLSAKFGWFGPVVLEENENVKVYDNYNDDDDNDDGQRTKF